MLVIVLCAIVLTHQYRQKAPQAPPPARLRGSAIRQPALSPIPSKSKTDVPLAVPQKLEPGVDVGVYPAGKDPEARGIPSRNVHADGFSGVLPGSLGESQRVTGWIKVEQPARYDFTLHCGELVSGKLRIDSVVAVEGKIEVAGQKAGQDFRSHSMQLNAGYHKVVLIIKSGVYAGGDQFWWDTISQGMEHTYVTWARAGQPFSRLSGAEIFRPSSEATSKTQ